MIKNRYSVIFTQEEVDAHYLLLDCVTSYDDDILQKIHGMRYVFKKYSTFSHQPNSKLREYIEGNITILELDIKTFINDITCQQPFADADKIDIPFLRTKKDYVIVFSLYELHIISTAYNQLGGDMEWAADELDGQPNSWLDDSCEIVR